MGINDRVDVGVPGGNPILVIRPVLSVSQAVDPPTSARGILACFLISMCTSSPGRDVSMRPNDASPLAIQIREPAHAVALEDPVQGRGRNPSSRS